MNHTVDIFECMACDTAVYLRVENEKALCVCGCLSATKSEIKVLSKKEKVEENIDYKIHHNVLLRVTKEKLENDYNEMHDKYGLIRNASKAIPALVKMAGRQIEVRKAQPYEDHSIIIERDIEYRLKLKEKDLEKM